jgi:diacylglycerol kinase (ATP)
MKRIAFIVNPVSGTKGKERVISYLQQMFASREGMESLFYTTKYAGDATRASREFATCGYDIVVAIGGDGTVNEVARGLIFTDTALGIVPIGSGNGLARHFRIPLSYVNAAEVIMNGKSRMIDAGSINGEIFFCTAGLGFEAEIGDRFNKAKGRGLITYVELCAKEFVKYKEEKYKISMCGNTFETDAFLITFANCSQWGNNVYIAPSADASDGMIDMVIWKKSPMVTMPVLAVDLLIRTINRSEFVDSFKTKEVKIERSSDGYIQFDGESRIMGKEINVGVLHNSVKIIVPTE